MKQTGSLFRIVLVALLSYSIVLYASVRGEKEQMDKELLAASERLIKLTEENDRMEERLSSGFSDEEMLRLARERLGLVLPGEKVFYFINRED